MRTIKRSDGRTVMLSDEVYEMCDSWEITDSHYRIGTLVRLISGVLENDTLGYHPSHARGWVTVCRVDAEVAEFIGVKKSSLKIHAGVTPA